MGKNPEQQTAEQCCGSLVQWEVPPLSVLHMPASSTRWWIWKSVKSLHSLHHHRHRCWKTTSICHQLLKRKESCGWQVHSRRKNITHASNPARRFFFGTGGWRQTIEAYCDLLGSTIRKALEWILKQIILVILKWLTFFLHMYGVDEVLLNGVN